MTHQDKGRFARKHGSQIKSNPVIAEAVKKAAKDQKISCPTAFRITARLSVSPLEVGVTIDLQEIQVTECQLGLFGYGPSRKDFKAADSVSQPLESAIRGALIKGKLTCASAWEIAEQFKISKKEVTSACEALKIKIAACQLGTF